MVGRLDADTRGDGVDARRFEEGGEKDGLDPKTLSTVYRVLLNATKAEIVFQSFVDLEMIEI
jgi:hypothetical protein